MHPDPAYSHALTLLELDDGRRGTGLTFTLGRGNEVVVRAIEAYAPFWYGRDLDEIMPRFAQVLAARWPTNRSCAGSVHIREPCIWRWPRFPRP